MAAHAPASVRESLAPLRWIRAADSPPVPLVARSALPAAAFTTGAYRFLAARGRSATAA